MTKLKVRLVKRTPRGYDGMNAPAAKQLGLPYPYPKDVVTVNRNLSKKRQREVARHERIEVANLKKGMSYHKAHKVAKAFEK